MAPPRRAAFAQMRGAVSDFFSAGWSATLVPGPHVEPGRVRGYHIDLRVKPKVTEWPPDWLRDGRDFIKIAQWALGSYERFLSGEGEAGLGWALEAGRFLVRSQQRDGPHDGGWEHTFAYPHTFDLRPPWLSAMAQGEALAANLHRWDTGYWSRYDLYPRPVPNLASSAYHLLHVNQLAAMHRVVPRPEFEETRARFERYARSAVTRTRAMAGKAAFRL